MENHFPSELTFLKIQLPSALYQVRTLLWYLCPYYVILMVLDLSGDELDALLLAYGLSTDHFNSVKLYRNDMDKRGVLSRFIQGTYKSV